MKLYKSDWIGICVGIIIGAFQPFVIIGNQYFLSFNDEVFDKVLLQVIAFGLIVPPLLAIITKYLIKSHLALYEKIGKYINLMRCEQLLETKANAIGTACPYCLIMLDDALKEMELENKIEVMDLAEVIENLIQSNT